MKKNRFQFNQLIWDIICICLVTLCSNAALAGSRTKPIRVQKDQTKSLSIVQLVLRVDSTSEVSEASDGLLSELAKDIKEWGYNVVGASDESVFSANDPNKAEMQIGGTINHLTCEDVPNYKYLVKCNIAVAWELYDTRKSQVVYKVLTRSRREVSVDDKYIADEVKYLFMGAVRSLLSREQFVSLMRRDTSTPTPTTPVAQYEHATFKACDAAPLTLPGDMEKAQNATVMIKVGAVLGSGFFISQDGWLLTAYHVASGAPQILVRYKDGKEYSAQMVRGDKKRDIALLKVDIPSSPCLRLGKETPSVGEDLFAIGAPAAEELAFSVSKGVISGLRELNGNRYIQTDASINPGNSGGPLLNLAGEAVGIVSWKINIPGFEGIAFGVPVDLATEEMAVASGSTTTLKVEVTTSATAPVDRIAVNDKDDPPFGSLPLEASSAPKEWRYSLRDRHFYSGWRYPLIIGGPILAVAGAALLSTSWMAYKTAEDDWSKESNPDYIEKSEYDKMKLKNTLGWALAGVGVGATVLFFITPRSKERIRKEKEAGLEKTVRRSGGSPIDVDVAFTGQGLLLNGRF